jgi:hypothetical protein
MKQINHYEEGEVSAALNYYIKLATYKGRMDQMRNSVQRKTLAQCVLDLGSWRQNEIEPCLVDKAQKMAFGLDNFMTKCNEIVNGKPKPVKSGTIGVI